MIHGWIDRAGTIASAACAVHCALMTFGQAVVSVVGLEFLRHEAFEWGFFLVAISLASLAAFLGYRSHGTRWVLVGFASGILVLSTARFGEALQRLEGGVAFAIIGGALLVASHVASLWRSHACHQECAA